MVAGLALALAAYQFVPQPPEAMLAVTCYDNKGEALTIKARSAFAMANVHMANKAEDYATLTVTPERGQTQTIADANLFCGISVA
jgi:hypothetical protein